MADEVAIEPSTNDELAKAETIMQLRRLVGRLHLTPAQVAIITNQVEANVYDILHYRNVERFTLGTLGWMIKTLEAHDESTH